MKLSTLARSTPRETAAWTLATWLGSGLSPRAPGTVGSFCTLPLAALGLGLGPTFLFLTAAVLFIAGVWATGIVLRSQSNSDPGFVVIDETVGQLLTFVLVASGGFSWYYLICGFALFRFFDIAKVWPASYFDGQVHTAFGVMMDDVIAGMYAALVLFGFSFLF